MGNLDLKHLHALAEAATPGPWIRHETLCSLGPVSDMAIASTGSNCTHADLIFVAAARTAVPELLDLVERLRARLAAAGDAARRFVALVDDLGAFADDGDPRVMALAAPIGEAQADLWSALGLDSDAEAARLQEDIDSRCAVCGWPLVTPRADVHAR